MLAALSARPEIEDREVGQADAFFRGHLSDARVEQGRQFDLALLQR
jgi:hypothetical protein